MNALVSIIIPVFNRANLIGETLLSIKEQTYENWECILIDDHSTDNTVEIIEIFLEDDKRFKLFTRPNNRTKGACSCRNYGFEKSKGIFVNWFDSDDIMHVDFILLKMKSFISDSSLDGVISKTAFFKNNVKDVYNYENRTSLSKQLLEDFISLKISWYLPDILWRKEFLKKKELFSEDLLMGQDRDFHIKMLAQKPKLSILDKYLTFYRKHDDSISSTYYSNKYKKNTISHLNASIELVIFLEKRGLLSSRIKTLFFNSGILYLPCTFQNRMNNKKLIDYLRKLFVFNIAIIKNSIKFCIAFMAYKLTGKGYAILKL